MDDISDHPQVDSDQNPLIDQNLDAIEIRDRSILSALCDPKRRSHRFLVLILICGMNFGNCFCYDNPAALQDRIIEDLDLNAKEYGVLYSVYAWPNTILAFLGGFLTDRYFGVRLSAVIFASFILAGQVVLGCGALFNSYGWLVIGRFIFALGGESLYIVQQTYIVKWFKETELNTVFGIKTSVCTLGVLNMYVMKPTYVHFTKYDNGPVALGLTLLLAGGSVAFISWLCALLLWHFDKRYDRLMTEGTADNPPVSSDAQVVSNPITPTTILQFPMSYWLLCVICITYTATVYPFVAYGLIFFITKFRLDGYYAVICNSLIYLLSAGFSLICGVLVDMVGRHVIWITISILLSAVAHAIFALTFLTPYLPLTIISVAYSLFLISLWPSIAFIVPANVLSTAYGVAQSIQNLFMALMYLAMGTIVAESGYLALELLFLCLLSCSLCAAVGLWIVDTTKGGTLNLSRRQRQISVSQTECKDE